MLPHVSLCTANHNGELSCIVASTQILFDCLLAYCYRLSQLVTSLLQVLIHPSTDTQLQYSASYQFDLRNATSFTGIPLFSDQGQAWIKSRTGSCMTPQTLCSFGRQWHNPRRLYLDADAANSSQSCELPPRSTVERYATIYCSSLECLVFPILSRCLFVKTLDLAYQSRESPSAASARSCVYSFLAMVSILRFENDSVSPFACESYAAAAASFIPQVTQEMTGDGLQMLVTLVCYTPLYYLFLLLFSTLSQSLAQFTPTNKFAKSNASNT